MTKIPKRHGRTTASIAPGRGRLPADDIIDVNPAIDCSTVSSLFGRPFPVQFRHQGAVDAWSKALEKTEEWRRWQDPSTLCRSIRQELSWQLDHMFPMSLVHDADIQRVTANRRILAVDISANLKYHLNKGTVIETTPALETLLTNSDVDLSLPMSLVAPPYRAQYLRFGQAAMQYLTVPASNDADRVFDGVFCFLTPDPANDLKGTTLWTLELIFISKRQDRYDGHVTLLGETDRGNTTVGEWLTRVLRSIADQPLGQVHRPMLAAVSYVVRVFLYMALKQARVIPHANYDEALCRAAGLGERKRDKALRKAASLYNSVRVGPESLQSPSPTGEAGSSVAPHWRRGHFRMQPFGPSNQQRKLIFVAPVLIHADQLQGEVPVPKSYRAGATAVTAAGVAPA